MITATLTNDQVPAATTEVYGHNATNAASAVSRPATSVRARRSSFCSDSSAGRRSTRDLATAVRHSCRECGFPRGCDVVRELRTRPAVCSGGILCAGQCLCREQDRRSRPAVAEQRGALLIDPARDENQRSGCGAIEERDDVVRF